MTPASPRSRRVLLSALGSVVLGGCLSEDAGSQGGEPSDENGADDEARHSYPTFDVTGDELNEEKTSLRPEVRVSRQPSESHPGQIEVAVTNAGSAPVTLAGGAPRPFSGLRSPWREPDSEPVVALFPSDTEHVSVEHVDGAYGDFEDRAEPVDGCWLVEAVHQDAVRVQRTIEPGDELGQTYSVYGRTATEECLPAGSYRFVDPRWEVDPQDGDEYTVEWGFTLDVEY